MHETFYYIMHETLYNNIKYKIIKYNNLRISCPTLLCHVLSLAYFTLFYYARLILMEIDIDIDIKTILLTSNLYIVRKREKRDLALFSC